ncbi:hypothetical protein MA16_Dca018022 [Dendrobium catenatum]|uniref:Uncharacterized protein n=1 Tax=Dendrobium catenatum TaxID=906689 RepID=A0A2I0WPE0_9ASPA|nr:hypothetical protein MA16_Dca018022 [Dendrobium catenatum]
MAGWKSNVSWWLDRSRGGILKSVSGSPTLVGSRPGGILEYSVGGSPALFSSRVHGSSTSVGCREKVPRQSVAT